MSYSAENGGCILLQESINDMMTMQDGYRGQWNNAYWEALYDL